MAEGEEKKTLQETFTAFAKFGDSKATGKTMTSKNFDKWMKESKVQGKEVKSQDTDIAFNKILGKKARGTKTIEFGDLDNVLTEVARHSAKEKAKKSGGDEDDIMNGLVSDFKEKLRVAKSPALRGATNASSGGVVGRLTDTTKYTGAHKERFDAAGKGKGKDGRVEMDKQASEGYVKGYKNRDTYEKK